MRREKGRFQGGGRKGRREGTEGVEKEEKN